MLILGQVRLTKGELCPVGLRKGLDYCPAGLEPTTGAKNMKKHPLKLLSIILYPVLNREVHLIPEVDSSNRVSFRVTTELYFLLYIIDI